MSYSIGRLAELSGLPVKTIRFYSDEGLLPATARTEAGHRRYAEAHLARLQLIRSLRDLGLDLPLVRHVLDGHGALPEVLAAHVATLETRIRGLHRQLAVLRSAATSHSEDTVRRVHQLARLDAAERRQLLSHFWDRALEGAPDPAVAARFRAMGSPELPDDPTPAQLDAWLELAELALDEDFQATTQRNATWAVRAAGDGYDSAAVAAAMHRANEIARQSVEANLAPSGAAAARAVDVLVDGFASAMGRTDSPEFRRWLRAQVEAHTDPRAARYWHLVNRIRGVEPAPDDAKRLAAGEWLWQAFRAHAAAEDAAPA